jgi:hypothetical protein
LHYAGYITENTASTLPIEMIEVEESVEGKLFVHIKKHEKTRFSNVKKLIILQFKAFLGNAASTEISFMNPRFSNEICEYALNLPSGNVRNGTFITDSICGIDLKAYPKKIIINSLYPNPIVKELKADFVCLEETNLSFTLYNTLGDIVYSAESKLYPVGEYKEFFDFSFLNYGIYYFKITENNTNFHLQKIIITK